MIGRPFVAVIPEQVQALGSIEAATVLGHLTYLQASEPAGVVATAADLAEGTGLSVRTVHRITSRLRELGVVTAVRSESWSATLRWSVVADHPICAGHVETAKVATSGSRKRVTSETAKVATSPTHLEAGEVPPNPPASEQAELPLLTVVPTVPDEPEPEAQQGPPKTAQTLVAQWCDGYRSVNNGQDAHRAVMGRVAGQARNLAKACGEDHDAWVDAYHAAYGAGVAGSWDLARHLVPQQQRRQSTAKRNVWADPAMGGPGAEAMGRFQTMMAGEQPRALGSSS